MLCADLGINGTADKACTNELRQIKESAQRMQSLILELLSQHKTSFTTKPDLPTPANWVAIIHDLLRQAEAVARAKGITLQHELPAVVLVAVERGSLSHITDNLLNNALKYSPSGSKVTIDLRINSGTARLRVADEGPGVPLAEREAIFAHGVLGSSMPSSGEYSHGLGLWIVRKLVTEASGRVWCEDSTSGGAAFVVELPC